MCKHFSSCASTTFTYSVQTGPDAGSTELEVGGAKVQFRAFQSLAVTLGLGADKVTVEGASDSLAISIDTAGGSDIVTLGMDSGTCGLFAILRVRVY